MKTYGERRIAEIIHDQKEREWSEVGQWHARKELLKKLRKATKEDYIPWLKGFVEKGGVPVPTQEPFNKEYSRDKYGFVSFYDPTFYVAESDLVFPARLYGWRAQISIIIPEGIRVEKGDWGHNEFYFMDGFKHLEFMNGFKEHLNSAPKFEDT
jgi:hypothetical protein